MPTRADAVAHFRYHLNLVGGDPTRAAQVVAVVDGLNWDADATELGFDMHDIERLIEAAKPLLPAPVRARIRERNAADLWEWIEEG